MVILLLTFFETILPDVGIRHVQSILPVVRKRPNIRSHSVFFNCL